MSADCKSPWSDEKPMSGGEEEEEEEEKTLGQEACADHQDEEVEEKSLSRRRSSSKSWKELKKAVVATRKRLSSGSRSGNLPSSFLFRDLEPQKTRLYFLAHPNIGYVDVGQTDQLLPWSLLIEASSQTLPSCTGKLSKEELLLSETKRCATWGINSFQMDSKSGKIIFPSCGSLFGCVDSGKPPVSPLYPFEIKKRKVQGAILNASMCPANPDLIASVINGDIWIIHAVSGDEVRVTFYHKGNESLEDDPLTCGIPAYVTQEEFERFEGFWWCPVCEDGDYQILYEVVDESDVELLRSSSGECIEELRFPRAGTSNAKSYLKLLKFKLQNDEEVVDVRHYGLENSLENLFPWMEYLVRAGWMSDGKSVWIQLLNRRQVLIELVMLPQKLFVPVQIDMECVTLTNGASPHPPSGQVQILCSLQSETWIKVNDILTFLTSSDLEDDRYHTLKFIWASEETGWRHLYLYTVQLTNSSDAANSDIFEEMCLRQRIISKVALTFGEWSVDNKAITVDSEKGLVFFQANKDTPLENHLYVVSLSQPGHIRRLTTLGYSHNVYIREDCSLCVTLFSSIHSVPGCQIFRLVRKDSTVDGISMIPSGTLLEPKTPEKDYHPPQLFSHKISSGDTLYSMIFKPHTLEDDRQYPIVLNIYGGPEVQLVSNAYKGMYQLRNHLLASQGYGVICIDSRGSKNRGTKMESHIHHRMGQVELADQIEIIHKLHETEKWMDIHRIAITGWSYGGYLSLMGLAKYPDLFKIAIAGAPVTSWNEYDTGYTERYMDLPSLNPSGYRKGSILNLVERFPDEPNRLLIVHGLMDENVHFHHHTAQLITQLVKYGKPHQIQVYPGERHSLRYIEASEHYETMLLSFLQLNL
ncbi:dipeptidyl peptidase 9 [Lepeophtheirus salmonis]|nr:dipeptidyl peptidase 9-like [Lepeophtheirus salmonis]